VLSIRHLRFAVRQLFHRQHLDQEMNEELQFHLDCTILENIKSGMNPLEARRTALAGFGGIPQIREECREALGLRILDEVRQDLRYTARQLINHRGFTILAVLVLALGIGANTAVFSVIDLLVYRPLPVRHPEQLVRNKDLLSYQNYLDIKKSSQSTAAFTSASWWPLEIWDSEYSESYSGRAVSADLFDVLGLKLAMGRPFLPEEDLYPATHPVAIISYRLWQRRFGGSPSTIGKTIRLNSELLTVVGVAPKGFRDINYNGAYRDVWIPLPMFRIVQHFEKDPIWSDIFEQRNKPVLMLIGRLNPGVSLQQAQARVSVIADQIKKAYPESVKYFMSDIAWNVQMLPLSHPRIPGRETLFSLNILLAAAGCIFLICCANVGSLLLGRAAARQREIATRYAVGASRFRVIRQLLTECLVISGIALAASFAVWKLTLYCLPALEGSLNEGSIGAMRDLDLAFEPRIFLIAAAIALTANLLFALLPAILGSRIGIGASLRDHGTIRGSASPRLRRILVVAQVVLSSVLLVGAGLFIRFIARFQSADPGFDTKVLVASPGMPFYDMDPQKGINFYRAASERIRSLPGVQSAGWSFQVPPENGDPDNILPDPVTIGFKPLPAFSSSISPGYFQTLRIPLIQGRDFSDQEIKNRPNVAIVNETMARAFWPGQAAVGQRVKIQNTYEVIGVVKDAGYASAWNGPKPCIYLPIDLVLARMPKLHVRVFGNPSSMINPIRLAFESFGPEARIREIKLLSNEMEDLLSRERSTAFILILFGGLALVLATVGLYGIIAYSAAQRSREFGIRLALGAQQNTIKALVLREGLLTVLSGLAVGMPCAMILSRLLANRLHGMSSLDPISYISIAVLWICVSVIAVLVPARKAISNPLNALRVE
jgi:macrolide transport system ATP-binding/permease protein